MANRFHLQGGDAAAWYSKVIVPMVFEPHSEDLVRRAHLSEGMRVVDLACGDGVVARTAAAAVGSTGSVVGIDLNQAMIAQAVAHPNTPDTVGYRVGDATQTGLEDASVDVVLCQQGLQFMPDQAAFVAEMRRILVPGGRALISVWREVPHNPWSTLLNEPFTNHLGPAAAAGRSASFETGGREWLRSVVTSGGFDDVVIEIVALLIRHPDIELLVAEQLATPAQAETIGALDEDGYQALAEDVAAGFDDYVDDLGVAIPFQTHIAAATKPT